MPEMTNYSGYDRDSNTFITLPETPTQLPESEAPTVIQNQENNSDKTDKLDKLFNQGLSSQYAELTEDALNVLNKLKEAVADTKGEPVKVKTVCDKHPLGRDRKSASEIRYYLGELVIANLAQKIGDEPSEIYLPIE